MSETPLDPVEAARVTLVEAEDLSRAARRLVNAADVLERAAAGFAAGLAADRPPDGRDLLTRYGAALEALESASSALFGLDDGLGSLRFVFTDESEPAERLRARAMDELRAHLSRRQAPRGR